MINLGAPSGLHVQREAWMDGTPALSSNLFEIKYQRDAIQGGEVLYLDRSNDSAGVPSVRASLCISSHGIVEM
jgi:hypothetical protein